MPARMTWLSSTSAPRAAGGTAPRSAGPFRVPSWVIAPLPGVRTARYPPVAGQRPPLPQPSAPAPAVRRASGRDNTGRVEPEPAPLAEYFDHWYADMSVSPVKDEIQQRHLGLPPHLLSSSLLGWEGIAEAVAAPRFGGGVPRRRPGRDRAGRGFGQRRAVRGRDPVRPAARGRLPGDPADPGTGRARRAYLLGAARTRRRAPARAAAAGRPRRRARVRTRR